MVRLSKLVEELGGTLEPAPKGRKGKNPDLVDVHVDSRRVGAGELFAALPGTRQDGARFAAQAVERGAKAILSPSPIPELASLGGGVVNWIHPRARSVAGEAAALVHGHPAREQRVVGITGTNGKSTVAHLCGCLLGTAGWHPAVIGTVEIRLWGDGARPSTHTTPDATELQRLCRRNLELGGDAFVLEVSSHALDQERISGLALDVALFTNLGHDHLDYHGDLEAYAAAKEKIFAHLAPSGAAAIHADDAHAERMRRAAERHTDRVVTYGIGSRADLRASVTEAGPQGSHLFLEGMGIPRTGLFLPLVGRHNVENALAALAAILLLEVSPSRALEGLTSVSHPVGRLEQVDTGRARFQVFVDYAHTPEALENALTTLRDVMSLPLEGEGSAAADEGRLLCVFGCGGDRDVEKRAPMGEIAGSLADLVIVTSDNPRDEDPDAIIRDVLVGLEGTPADVHVEPDRRAAIRTALRRAEPGDVVLIAGKGHETWQLSRGRRLPFEDQRVVREELP